MEQEADQEHRRWQYEAVMQSGTLERADLHNFDPRQSKETRMWVDQANQVHKQVGVYERLESCERSLTDQTYKESRKNLAKHKSNNGK